MPSQRRMKQVSIYMGLEGLEADERIARLDSIAQRLGVNRSEFIQKIADGELQVVSSQEVCGSPLTLANDCDLMVCELHLGHTGRHQAHQDKAFVTWD